MAMCYGWEGLGLEMSVIIMEDIGLEMSFYTVGHSLLVGDICRRKVIGYLTSPRGFSFFSWKSLLIPNFGVWWQISRPLWFPRSRAWYLPHCWQYYTCCSGNRWWVLSPLSYWGYWSHNIQHNHEPQPGFHWRGSLKKTKDGVNGMNTYIYILSTYTKNKAQNGVVVGGLLIFPFRLPVGTGWDNNQSLKNQRTKYLLKCFQILEVVCSWDEAGL